MKIAKIFPVVIISLLLLEAGYPRDNSGFFSVFLKNNSDINRVNELVELPLDSLAVLYPGFDSTGVTITEDDNAVNFETVYDEASGKKKLLLGLSFKPGETKEIIFSKGAAAPGDKITQAYLGGKKNYIKTDGYYTGGNFESISFTSVPPDHFAHNALYQYEGPGWESEKVGYRLYLDDRNRTDIFGKKEPGLITDKIGKEDLVSDGKESYQQMQDWGQDIFKVGNSLGIGSVAAYYDSVITISDYDSATCEIFDNNLLSTVKTTHYGWNINNQKTNVECYYSISAGSRLTHVIVKPENEIENFCTGIAKHKGTEFFVSDNKDGWNYIALWGKQTTANDNLGAAVFYKNSDVAKISEDALSHFVILNPDEKNIGYYFAAAWEQEPNGIKSRDEFQKYLDEEAEKLNKPVQY
ncbi:MAG: DUF4861 family protein [Ignavibacteriaceae bacterium]